MVGSEFLLHSAEFNMVELRLCVCVCVRAEGQIVNCIMSQLKCPV